MNETKRSKKPKSQKSLDLFLILIHTCGEGGGYKRGIRNILVNRASEKFSPQRKKRNATTRRKTLAFPSGTKLCHRRFVCFLSTPHPAAFCKGLRTTQGFKDMRPCKVKLNESASI